jgi:hypothetical protein
MTLRLRSRFGTVNKLWSHDGGWRNRQLCERILYGYAVLHRTAPILIQMATALYVASNPVYASLCPVRHYFFGHQPSTALRHKQQWVDCVWIVYIYIYIYILNAPECQNVYNIINPEAREQVCAALPAIRCRKFAFLSHGLLLLLLLLLCFINEISALLRC